MSYRQEDADLCPERNFLYGASAADIPTVTGRHGELAIYECLFANKLRFGVLYLKRSQAVCRNPAGRLFSYLGPVHNNANNANDANHAGYNAISP